MQSTFDAIILGGGAAGLMCAIEAGKRKRRVVVLEHADRIGKKILISGGGRCNFTNLYCSPENFLSANPHFCKSAMARYTPADFIALVERHRIPFHEKARGQLFCDGSAREIVAMLEAECRDAGATILLKTRIQQVEHGQRFTVRTSGDTFHAPVLVVATGGLSIPKMGATGLGYDLARQFGVSIRECQPGLVPLVLNSQDRQRYCDLAGVSTEIVAALEGTAERFQDKMLITHRGLSGPAVLQISSYWRPPLPLKIDLAPGREVIADLKPSESRRDMPAAKAALRTALPQRLADRWLDVHPPLSWTNHGLAEFERELHHWQVIPAGTEGYEKAEVTVGGVDTNELSAKTMECRKVPGLYFIGEVVDVTGHLGGFNFQWAWASGYCAGQAL
jgi:predicted Rossmann fold flavoprotein